MHPHPRGYFAIYCGLEGLLDLPDKFHAADEQGRTGYLDWGMMSTTSDRDVAFGYSGVKQRRPRAAVMVVEATSVDRGADISEFSQYPLEKEFLWVPLQFCAAVAGWCLACASCGRWVGLVCSSASERQFEIGDC